MYAALRNSGNTCESRMIPGAKSCALEGILTRQIGGVFSKGAAPFEEG